MSEHVIVAVDGGPGSDAALGWAIDRARSIETHLELLTVVDIHRPRAMGRDLDLAAHERVLLEAGRKVGVSGIRAHCSTTLHHGGLVAGLVAASRRADLLVMGSDERELANGAVHGTLAPVVVARTRSPVVVVPAGWKAASGG